MEDNLYKELCDINLLRRGWHLARNDTRDDFIFDVFRNNDFAINLEENLKSISLALEKKQYHPNPLLYIDVPKSTLTVRPGSVISIEDRTVLFSIVYLIAPILDKKLPDNVYSYRLKKKKDKKLLFKDKDILKFPFLKRRTIQKRINIIESWYGQWTKFIEKAVYTFKEEEYKFLAISDISSYFENINISILERILLKYLPKEPKIVNLLCSLLQYWTWPTKHGLMIERGIPQGNDVSSFLANIYLLPLDKELIKFEKRGSRYFRYVDDVLIFSKKEEIARRAIFVMNDALRELHLNIQGSKTIIKKGEEIRQEIDDIRLTKVSKIIDDMQNNLEMTKEDRDGYINGLKEQYKEIKMKHKIIQGKDLRLYRRLITGFTLLRCSYMVDNILKQIPMNPDFRLMDSSIKYFKNLPLSNKKISNKLIQFLKSPLNIFSYQEAHTLRILRQLRNIPDEVIEYSKKCLRLKSKHWYIRVQAALLLANLDLPSRSLDSLKKLYKKEINLELRRSLVKCLCQLEKEKLKKFLRELIFENHNKLSSLGRMLNYFYYNHNNEANREVSNLFREFKEDVFIESYYKIDVIKHCKIKKTRKNLLKKLKIVKRIIKRERLKSRVEKTINLLESSLNISQRPSKLGFQGTEKERKTNS